MKKKNKAKRRCPFFQNRVFKKDTYALLFLQPGSAYLFQKRKRMTLWEKLLCFSCFVMILIFYVIYCSMVGAVYCILFLCWVLSLVNRYFEWYEKRWGRPFFPQTNPADGVMPVGYWFSKKRERQRKKRAEKLALKKQAEKSLPPRKTTWWAFRLYVRFKLVLFVYQWYAVLYLGLLLGIVYFPGCCVFFSKFNIPVVVYALLALPALGAYLLSVAIDPGAFIIWTFLANVFIVFHFKVFLLGSSWFVLFCVISFYSFKYACVLCPRWGGFFWTLFFLLLFLFGIFLVGWLHWCVYMAIAAL